MYRCNACGYPRLKEPQRYPLGSVSDEICPACGFQSGYTDDLNGISYQEWRDLWLANGMKWSSSGLAPSWWDPAKHLNDLLESPEADSKPSLPDEPDS